MAKYDGGSAFPTSASQGIDSVNAPYPLRGGMSLRDYFAGQAMNSLFWDTRLADDSKEAENIAERSYMVADAMLAERAK